MRGYRIITKCSDHEDSKAEHFLYLDYDNAFLINSFDLEFISELGEDYMYSKESKEDFIYRIKNQVKEI